MLGLSKTHLGKVARFTALTCGLVACSASYDRSSLEPNVLIPLSVGNSWSYEQVGGSETAKSEVLKSEVREGSYWFLYNEFGDKFWLRNDDENQVEAVNAFDSDELPGSLKEEIIFRSPDKAPADYSIDGRRIRYHSCEEKLKVPAGTFPCHVYTVDLGNGNSSINYYSPGVGLIRNELTIDTRTVIFELTDYRIE